MKIKRVFSVSICIYLLVLFLPFIAVAQDLGSADKALINGAGIPIYSDVVFINGNKDVGFRFASAKGVEEVQEWYRQKLSDWNVYEQYGGWILHNGPADSGMADLMSKNQIQVQSNAKLAEWFGVDKSMSTEIVIFIP